MLGNFFILVSHIKQGFSPWALQTPGLDAFSPREAILRRGARGPPSLASNQPRQDFGTARPPSHDNQKYLLRGFPGGAVVENPPANAGDTGSSPGLGRSHMPRSNWAREPQLLSLRVWSLCSATREAAIVRGPRTAMKSGPRSPQLEKAHAQKRRPNRAKNKLIN